MKLSGTGKLLLLLISIPVVLVLLVVLYYQFDEDLRPEVVEILNYEPEKIAANGTATMLFWGCMLIKTQILMRKGC